MKNAETSPFLSELADVIRSAGASVFQPEMEAALAALDAEYTNTDALIHAAQLGTRMAVIVRCGQAGNAALKEDLEKFRPRLWKDVPAIEADGDLQKALGAKLYNIKPHIPDPHAMLLIGAGSGVIMGEVITRLRSANIPFLPNVSDDAFTRIVFSHASEADIETYAAWWIARNDKITNRIIALPNADDDGADKAPKDEAKHRLFGKLTHTIAERSRSGVVMWTLTYFPTQSDAEIDGIPLPDYLKLYFEMCDQPEDHIRAANDRLIEKLNKASTVRFTNKDGTDISMSLIDENGTHFTFANSMTQRNIPGSEVFSAPRRDSLNGTIVARGKFMPKSNKAHIITDLTLKFENGKIVSFDAASGAEHFQAFLDRHPNNAYTGELGIGTNPHLKRHVANGLLVEKISSSFHLALGDAYTMTDYLGQPVYLNNGNQSIDHWDVTTMLGDMYLDGEIVMKDGMFLDPALDILNRGWAAVPVEERPEYWRDYKGAFKG